MGIRILASLRLRTSQLEFFPSEQQSSWDFEPQVGKLCCAYAPNNSSEYSAFLEMVKQVLERIPPTDTIMLLDLFNAHVGNYGNDLEGCDWEKQPPRCELSGKILDSCASHRLSITNTLLEQNFAHICTWHQSTLGQRSVIYFGILSIRRETICFGQLGEERGSTVNWSPLGG